MTLFDPTKPPKSVSSPQTPRMIGLVDAVGLVGLGEPGALRIRLFATAFDAVGRDGAGDVVPNRAHELGLALRHGDDLRIEGDAGERAIEGRARDPALLGERPKRGDEFLERLLDDDARGRMNDRFDAAALAGNAEAGQYQRDAQARRSAKAAPRTSIRGARPRFCPFPCAANAEKSGFRGFTKINEPLRALSGRGETQASTLDLVGAGHRNDVVARIDKMHFARHALREAREQIERGAADILDRDRAPKRRMRRAES